jgi:hypothetical protein
MLRKDDDGDDKVLVVELDMIDTVLDEEVE